MGTASGWEALAIWDSVPRLRWPPSLCRMFVHLVPAVQDPHMSTFLQKLRVDWPTASERASIETLKSRVYAGFTSVHDGEKLPPGVLGRLCLKDLVEEQGHRAGYDPTVDNCLGRTWSLAEPERRKYLSVSALVCCFLCSD